MKVFIILTGVLSIIVGAFADEFHPTSATVPGDDHDIPVYTSPTNNVATLTAKPATNDLPVLTNSLPSGARSQTNLPVMSNPPAIFPPH